MWALFQKKKILDKSNVNKNNIVLAIPSSGIHSNGYSLVRSILKKKYPSQNFQMEEKLSSWEELMEFFMVRSRVSWGFNYSELPKLSNVEPEAFKVQLQNCVDKLISEGLVVSDGVQVCPTTRGFQFADTVAQKLVNTLSELVHYR